MQPPRFWNGPAVHVATTSPTHDRRTLDVAITPEVAGQLANLLRKQTGLGSILNPLPEGLMELMNALGYVLVADPASVAAHRRLDASKGMEPAGADPRSYGPTVDDQPTGIFPVQAPWTPPERPPVPVWRTRGFDSKAQMQEFEARPGFPGWDAL